MDESEEEIPTKGPSTEGTFEGASRRARYKRVKPKQLPYTMKYKYQENPIPSKFDSKVSKITGTLMGHMDLGQFRTDVFLEDATPRAQRIAELGLAHVASFPIAVQYPEFILIAAATYNPTQRQCIDSQSNVIIDLIPTMMRLLFELPPYPDVKMMNEAKVLDLWNRDVEGNKQVINK